MHDTIILTDKRFERNRPDEKLVKKNSYEWILIGVAIAWDIGKGEQSKTERGLNVAGQINEM